MKQVFIGLIAMLVLSVITSNAYAKDSLDERIANLSIQIYDEISATDKSPTIAIVEFSDLQGNITDFGRYVSEELITHIFRTKKVKVIERLLLTKIIKEQKLSLTGIIEPDSAKKLGKLMGVQFIVCGTIADKAQSLKINARLINTESGEIFAVAATEIFKDESVLKLLASGVTPSGNPSQTTPDKKSDAQPKKDGPKVEADKFTYEVISCKLSDSTLTVEVIITNNSEDDIYRHFFVQQSDYTTKILDDVGNEYFPVKMQIGNQILKVEKDGNTCIKYTIISGSPTKAVCTFEKLQGTPKVIKALTIGFYNEQSSAKRWIWTYGAVVIRDIPIEK
ncbi:MAG: FlgO family outer membrane protein [Planctomycetota bacterium]|nr:FlgO family outer membrane protein [Planctomycetota bacterium]MDI6786848.1 FlgO family outer membrane protein [Planctomycetota bacterium]